jgi:hypothetical protein
MAEYSELDAMSDIQKALDQITDPAARGRALRWAIAKYSDAGVGVGALAAEELEGGQQRRRTSRRARGSANSSRKSVTTLSLVKDLNLRPSGKQAFRDFATEKSPTSHLERCATAVYYLTHVLERETVGVNDVYTCFKDQGWRVPADLKNTLQSAASHRGWLDTSDIEDIRVVPAGENLIEHDLPRAKTK